MKTRLRPYSTDWISPSPALEVIAALTLIAGALSACTATDTDTAWIGALPALGAEGPHRTIVAESTSLGADHDRSHWTPQTVAVPSLTVDHHPTWVSNLEPAPTTPRERGAYPTATDALDVAHRDGEAAWVPLQIAHCGLLLIKAPIDMLFGDRPPNRIERSPADDYELLPAPATPPRRWMTAP